VQQVFVKMPRSLIAALSILVALTMGPTAHAAAVTRLQVRVITGDTEFAAGSLLQLRIYQTGNIMQQVALTHGESWPAHSTVVLPVTLTTSIDPRDVRRVGLYYRSASFLAPSFEIIAADVEYFPESGAPLPLLDATLAGVFAHDGELGSEERGAGGGARCATDADCDDHRSCNGRERCAPESASADARGCVKGAPMVCPVNQICTEDRGCRGVDEVPKN
jgi:hypothetical protein